MRSRLLAPPTPSRFSRTGEAAPTATSVAAAPPPQNHTPALLSGVTSLAFSAEQPNVLAVGLYDGSVCIYDVRKPDAPLLEAGHAGGKHTDPVWGLRWVAEGKGLGEALVSISTDGRVRTALLQLLSPCRFAKLRSPPVPCHHHTSTF